MVQCIDLPRVERQHGVQDQDDGERDTILPQERGCKTDACHDCHQSRHRGVTLDGRANGVQHVVALKSTQLPPCENTVFGLVYKYRTPVYAILRQPKTTATLPLDCHLLDLPHNISRLTCLPRRSVRLAATMV